MSIIKDLVGITERIDGLNGLAEAFKKFDQAETKLDMTAAASQIVAELAVAGAVTATLRTAMSALRLGLAVSGQIWKWEVLSKLVGVGSGLTAGAIIDWVNDQNIGSQIYDWTHTVSPTLGTTHDPLVKTIVYVDPLVLDLDGDGLEITPLSKGVLFDANGDTVKTGTAWVGADDGLLVWDRNGNGTIDSGAELFGDETLLSNGQKAAHGFAALSELDTGSLVDGNTVGAGDGVFDAQDAQYSSLRIWRDLNQDGISQANELQTLAQTGVRSIKLASRTENTNYGDAILAQSGSFTRTDGSTGQAGSFILAQNNFAREFVPIAVSDAAKALLDLKGSGWVRDLREAGCVQEFA
jgi:hypothetical protein